MFSSSVAAKRKVYGTLCLQAGYPQKARPTDELSHLSPTTLTWFLCEKNSFVFEQLKNESIPIQNGSLPLVPTYGCPHRLCGVFPDTRSVRPNCSLSLSLSLSPKTPLSFQSSLCNTRCRVKNIFKMFSTKLTATFVAYKRKARIFEVGCGLN